MTTSTNKIQPEGACRHCGCVTRAFLLPAIFDLPARWISAPTICSQCLEAIEEIDRQKKIQERIEAVFKASRMTPRFRDRTFENFHVHALNQTAYQAAFYFEPERGESLLLYGNCGIGKTHLAAAVANKFLGKMGLLYISCPDLLLEIRESMNGKAGFERLSVARQVPLLILDDIGAEKPSEWVQETLFVLVNHRYEHKLPTIFTTNCSLSELDSRLGGRIVSRIVEMCRCVKFEGKDFRMLRNKFPEVA